MTAMSLRLSLCAVAIFVLIVFPAVVLAQGLVPCGGVNCGLCHVVQLGQNIINFLIGVSVFIAVGFFVYAGFMMVTAGGDIGKVGKAKNIFSSVAIGMILVLVAWLGVDVLMKNLFDEGEFAGFGPWNSLQCVVQPTLVRNPNPGQGRATVGGGTTAILSEADISNRIERTGSYQDFLCAQAAAQGIANQCSRLQAIVAVESNGDPNAISKGVGAVGLMQIMPNTARLLDPALRGKSDAEVIAALKDPYYNMQLGVEHYARDYETFGGDTTLTTAAFNAGPGANGASANCAGLRRWECEWDNDAHTVRNVGYEQTRSYVKNVDAITAELEAGS